MLSSDQSAAAICSLSQIISNLLYMKYLRGSQAFGADKWSIGIHFQQIVGGAGEKDGDFFQQFDRWHNIIIFPVAHRLFRDA